MGGSESKTRFRELVQKLLETNVAADDQAYWNSIFLFPGSSEDVFVMVPPVDIRHLIEERTENLKQLIETAIRLMENYSQQLLILNESISLSVQNAVRILTRILPLTFEEQETSGFKSYWWRDGKARKLMDATMRMLFMPTYSVIAPFSKATETVVNRVDSSLLWRAGLNARLETNKQMNMNRMELLKLLVACMSEPLYSHPTEVRPVPSLWRFYLTSPACPFIHNLTYSLLYTSLAYDPSGYAWLPYSNRFDRFYQEELSEIGLQALLVLMDWSPPSLLEIGQVQDFAVQSLSAYIEANSTSEVHSNEVSRCLSSISSEEDLQLLYTSLMRILTNVVSSESTYLPGSLKQVKFYHEAMMLLWGLIRRNKLFSAFILTRNLAQELIVPVLFLMTENMEKKEQFGLVCLGVFVLLHFSEWREFGVRLNRDFQEKTPAALPLFSGTYADLIFMSLAHIITNGPASLQPMYSCIFIILANISPYLKSLSISSSAKFMSLLEMFTLKKWLLAGPGNPDIVMFWLEIANNMIQYQWTGAYHLTYQILRKKQLFVKLMSLEVSDTQSEDSKHELSSVSIKPEISFAPHQAEERKQEPTAPLVWTPTAEWMQAWKARLQLQVIHVLLDKLLPQVEEYCRSHHVKSELEVIAYIKQTSMVGLLPPPHRLVMRKHETERSSEAWLSSYLWSVIYLKMQDVPLFDGQKIKLFEVKYAERDG